MVLEKRPYGVRHMDPVLWPDPYTGPVTVATVDGSRWNILKISVFLVKAVINWMQVQTQFGPTGH